MESAAAWLHRYAALSTAGSLMHVAGQAPHAQQHTPSLPTTAIDMSRST